jgi:hypothetical protein
VNRLNMPGKKAGIWMDQEKAYIIMEGDHEPI